MLAILAYLLRVEIILKKKHSPRQSRNFSTLFARTRECPNPEQEDIFTLPRIAPSFNFNTINQRFAF
jgi:hypothetical protein